MILLKDVKNIDYRHIVNHFCTSYQQLLPFFAQGQKHIKSTEQDVCDQLPDMTQYPYAIHRILPGCRRLSKVLVVGYLLAGMAWALVGFLWIFGTHNSETCNHESSTYKVGQIENKIQICRQTERVRVRVCERERENRFIDRQKERE